MYGFLRFTWHKSRIEYCSPFGIQTRTDRITMMNEIINSAPADDDADNDINHTLDLGVNHSSTGVVVVTRKLG